MIIRIYFENHLLVKIQLTYDTHIVLRSSHIDSNTRLIRFIRLDHLKLSYDYYFYHEIL